MDDMAQLITADDLIRTGACASGVLEWRRKHAPLATAIDVDAALAMCETTVERDAVRCADDRCGYGDGYGDGDGDGSGSGSGYGDGYGDGSGYGYGSGSGYGYGDGDGDGSGYGDGYGD
jgi:hypothetical protein